MVLPILWMLALVGQELMAAYRGLAHLSAEGSYILPGFIRGLPWVCEQLQQEVNRYSAEWIGHNIVNVIAIHFTNESIWWQPVQHCLPFRYWPASP